MRPRLIAFVLCLALLIVAFPAGNARAADAPKNGLPVAISLEVVPPALPADGNTYRAAIVSLVNSSDLPSFPVSAVNVYLSSSQQNVATVNSSVVIEPGSTYAIADLTTTVTPGSCVITAAAPGLQSASGTVTTAIPSGFPSKLAVFLAPSTVLARPNSQGLFFVELLDQKALPTRAGQNITVHMSSSNLRVANVSQSSLTIQAGTIEAEGAYSTTFLPGTAAITASSPGLTGGNAMVTVAGPAPYQLLAYVQPSSMPLSTAGRLTIVLTDASGNPARAPSAITVQVTSSNTSVAAVPSEATIQAGSIYALANVTTTDILGKATITVSHTGLVSASAQVTSVAPSYEAESLSIGVAPPIVLADDTTYNSLVISLVDASGAPALAPSNVSVQLSSSTPQVGTVPQSVTIVAGENFVAVPFFSTYFSGQTIITASASNLQSDQEPQTTYGPVPVKIALKAACLSASMPNSCTLPADGNSYQALEVLLEDALGNPAVAPTSLTFQLLSSSTGIVSIPAGSVTIPAGAEYSIVNVKTSTLSGQANLTAFAPGFTASPFLVSTEVPAPSRIVSYVAPAGSIMSSAGAMPVLVVQLQDSGGNPARAKIDTPVLVTSSNAGMLQTPLYLAIPEGSDYVMQLLNLTSSGATTLTVTSPGLVPTSSILTASLPSISASVSPSYSSISAGQSEPLTAILTAEGQPVNEFNVTWTVPASQGFLSATKTTTSTGTSTVSFTSNVGGYASILVVVQSAATGKVVTYSTVKVIGKPTLVQTLFKYYLILLVPVIVIVVSVIAFVTFRKRRRAAREELEAGFQELS